ncbi:hypothetical protein LZ554_000138 [Drepanopeziza brunnea f. sp. 'monogermtubi']|nr:hypothetical protein LZ554_000138 [Drepanopeziza brunnea f. sp. 'monogermtubi']
MSAIRKDEVGGTVVAADADVELGRISMCSLTSTLCRPPTNFTTASTLKDAEIPQPGPAKPPRLQRVFLKIGQWLKKKYLKSPGKFIFTCVLLMGFVVIIGLSAHWMAGATPLPEIPLEDRDTRVLPPTLA